MKYKRRKKKGTTWRIQRAGHQLGLLRKNNWRLLGFCPSEVFGKEFQAKIKECSKKVASFNPLRVTSI